MNGKPQKAPEEYPLEAKDSARSHPRERNAERDPPLEARRPREYPPRPKR